MRHSLLILAAAALCGTARAEPPEAGQPPNAVVPATDGEPAAELLVGAYYYPWYAAPRARRDGSTDRLGWMRQAVRGRLVPPQLPLLGVYDSRDAELIGQHLAQSVAANIRFWAVSWWGPGGREDRTLREQILPHPDSGKLQYAVLYESTGRLGSFDEPDYSRLLSDFAYLSEHYFSHPAYLHIDGRPVVFIYLTRVYFRNRGQRELQDLRSRFPQLYLIGDEVFGPHYRSEYAEPWDAVTAYDVYGQSLKLDGATRQALDRLDAVYASARQAAHAAGTAFVPAVSPGYNDRAVREGHPGRPRYFTDVPDSQEGDVFRRAIRQCGWKHRDPAAANMMMVTSFNEWYEDTQIEPTAGEGPTTRQDDSPSADFFTHGDAYPDYGTLYLEILREETTRSGASDRPHAR